jgi:chitodextrinase
LLAAGIVVVQLGATSTRAGAVSAPHDRPVSQTPAKWTPQVRDGWVNAITQVGSTMVLGGRFTSVSQTLTSTAVPRTNLLAFDATTGTLTPFAPNLDGDVYTLLPGPTPNTVYAGGVFNNVNGVATKSLVLLDLGTGQIVSGWSPPYINGWVADLTLLNGHLVAGGAFTEVDFVARNGMASFDPATGHLDDYAVVSFTEHHNYNGSGADGAVGIENFDVSPDQTKMVVIGNFKKADGLARDQAAMLDLTGARPAVSTAWATTKFSSRCSGGSFDSWVRDVDFAPDGSYFAIATTGGPWPGTMCDTVSRWETSATGSDVPPTWVNATGGDTLFSVAVTGAAVYVGGHERWANNPLGTDSAKAGAVPRPGIGAFDPVSGVPLSWNAARHPRGQGAFALLATPAGLWVGSDTEWVGNFNWHRDRIAFFPIAGAPPAVVANPWSFPNNLYQGGPTTSGANTLTKYYRLPDRIDYTSPGPASDMTWPNVRGAFVAGPWLYYGYSDGLFYRRSFDGTTVGSANLVDPYNDPLWSTVSTGSGSSTYRGVQPDMYGKEMTRVDGMFYDNGRLWYTTDGSSAINWRPFSPESGIMGAKTTISTAGMPTGVRGMFLAGGKLYYAWGTGVLTRADFGPNGPVAGTATIIGGPLVDGIDWRSRALFVGPGPLPPVNQTPNATFAVSCTTLACSFDASASADPDGTITSYAWNFGDGSTGTGRTTPHVFGSADTYQVTLTLTDNRLGTATAQRTLTVSTSNVAPTASFTVSCNDLDCTFDSGGSSDSDGTITDASWNFGDGATANGRVVTHSFAGTGTYQVGLTVTDNQGATDTAQRDVSVNAAPAVIDFRAAAHTQVNAVTARLTVPAAVQPGDGMLLFATFNTLLANAPAAPAGWTAVARQDAGSMTTVLWQRTADASDPGATVTVDAGATMKIDVQFAAYAGTATAAVAQTATAADQTTKAGHVTPTVTVAGRGSRVVSFWADKSSTTNSWTAPASVTVRSTSIGTGSGRITSLLADDGTNVAAGSAAGGLTATTDTAGAKATMWTVVLSAAPR